MGIVTLGKQDNLYWLGRYTERVFTTIKFFAIKSDTMIDEEVDSYPQFCEMLDIPNIYTDKADFMRRYVFDDANPDSILSNLNRAYDNAIVLRESIGSETLAFIQLAIYEMNRASISSAPLISMQKVMDNIMAFWGAADDQIDEENVRNLIKAGKRIERLDLYARLENENRMMIREVNRLVPRVERSGVHYHEDKLILLKQLAYEPEIDYIAVLGAVNSIY